MFKTREHERIHEVYTPLDLLEDENLLEAICKGTDFSPYDGAYVIPTGGWLWGRPFIRFSGLKPRDHPTSISVIVDEILDSKRTIDRIFKKHGFTPKNFNGLLVFIYLKDGQDRTKWYKQMSGKIIWFHKKYDNFIRFALNEGYTPEERRKMIALLRQVDKKMQAWASKKEAKKTERKPLPKVRRGRYRHFKGGTYRVSGVVRDSETGDAGVRYTPLYGSHREELIRPYKMFFEKVRIDGKQVPRFRYIGKGK